MKAVHLLLAVSAATVLSGCSQFSKSYFYEKSFGIDLNEYVGNYETSYTDGILEVYEVSSTDDLYKEFFEKYPVLKTTEKLFGYKWKRYYPSEDSPILYIPITNSRTDGYGKYVLYLPKNNMMIFIYADAMGA